MLVLLDWGHEMKGSGLGVTALLVLILVPVAALGQGLTGLGSVLPAMDLGRVNAGFLWVLPSVGFGFEQVGLNFSIPTSTSFVLGGLAPVNGPQPLDIRMAGAHVWLAQAGLDASLGSGFSFFANGRCSFPNTVTVESTHHPLFTVSVLQFSSAFPLRWEGSKLKTWEVDCGLQYFVGNGMTFLGGVRYDKFSVDFRELSSPEANFTALLPALFNPVVDDLRNVGDIRSKLWIPFVGIAVQGPNYRGSILWSPFVSANVSVPLGLLVAVTDTDFLGDPDETFQSSTRVAWKYNVLTPAAFVEGKFEYDHIFSPQTFLTLWLRGTYLDVGGTGTVDLDVPFTVFENGTPIASGTSEVEDSASATFRRYTISFGLSASYLY